VRDQRVGSRRPCSLGRRFEEGVRMLRREEGMDDKERVVLLAMLRWMMAFTKTCRLGVRPVP
jgi:hypothetical protein